MTAYIWGIAFIFLLFQVGAVFGLWWRRNDIADVLWGPGFFLAGLGALFGLWKNSVAVVFGATEYLIFAVVGIWALRLSLYVGFRYFKKGKEDVRYNNWRKQWGDTWVWRSYLQVFVLQPLILTVIALPILKTVAESPQPLNAFVAIGACIWVFGFLFESIADFQLKQFSEDSKNKGRIMNKGLWSWSRHPNYFGEVTMWWGIFIMTVTWHHWWLVFSPITITYLIIKVSGVSMLEELMKDRPGFSEYKRRTSVFIPLPPKA